MAIPIPPQFDDEHARRWHDADAAAAYRHRPGYSAEAFAVLLSLMTRGPRVVLDVGCGTGNIARGLAPLVERVDAIDFAPEMIAEGRGLPGGDASNIRWQVARAEEAELDPPYALVVGGASLHWMRWHVVLPRFAEALVPGGKLVVAAPREMDNPWDEAVKEIVSRYSTNQAYIPFDMIPLWEGEGVFRLEGEQYTVPEPFEQTIDEFIAAFHAMSTLTRAHIAADAFDAEVQEVMRGHFPDGIVRRETRVHLVWGTPLAP